MTDLRAKTLSVACALALAAGCIPAPAFAESASETPPAVPTEQTLSQDSGRDPVDKALFFQPAVSDPNGIALQSADLDASVTPKEFSSEFMYYTKYESGKNYDQGLSWGDDYHAMGCYQFDNRYGLQDFLIACYNYDPATFSMFAWLKDSSLDLASSVLYDENLSTVDSNGNQKQGGFTEIGKKLNDSWHTAYKADSETFSRLQDGWQYQEYIRPAFDYLNARGLCIDSRHDCIKGLVSGVNALFGSGGWRQFVGGKFNGVDYPGAGLTGTMSDKEFATSLCTYIVDNVASFYPYQPAYWEGWQNRYRNELQDCLAYLESGLEPVPDPEPTPTPSPEPTLQFADVAQDAWYANSVQAAAERGIINGWTNESGQQVFNPDGTVTRGQLITMLWRIQGNPQADTSTKAFSDVAYGEYYGDAIRWARATKIVEGYGDNTFRPENPVTREDIALMVANFANRMDGKNPTSDGVNLSKYPDANQVDTWAKSSLSWAVDKEIITGWKDAGGKAWLKPTNTATRAEAATILLRYLDAR